VRVRQLTRETISLWWENLGRIVVLAAPVFLTAEFAVALVDPTSNGPFANVSLYGAFSTGLYLALYPMVQAAIVAHFAGLGSSIPAAYDRGADRLHTLAGATFLYGICTAVGLLFLIVPGLLAFARFGLYIPVLVLERPSASGSLRRSAQLVRGQTGVVLGVLVLTLLFAFALSLVPAFVYALENPVAAWLGGTAIDMVLSSLSAAAAFVLYQRLREEA
jgi:hypothetical protein